MDMYELKFTRLQLEIFRMLCIKGGDKLNKRQIAKLLKVSPTAVAKALHLLEKEELVKISKQERNISSVWLNRENRRTLLLKRVENLKMIYESGLLEFLEENFPGSAIILFGSYSRGDDVLKSDIDIAIIKAKEKSIDLSVFEKKLERKINLNFYSSFKDMHKEFRENLCNGIVLSGGVEL